MAIVKVKWALVYWRFKYGWCNPPLVY